MYIGDQDYFIQGVLKTSAPILEMVLADIGDYYRTVTIPKAGGVRTICAIERDSRLFELQKNLCKNFLEKIPLPTPAVGFVKNESYLSFLTPHAQKNFYLRLDIKDFFGSITTKLLEDHFRAFFSDEDSLTAFISLCTLGGTLPQGAVTSPVISNIVLRRADQRILKYCQSFDFIYRGGRREAEDIRYTRYADDLLFSSKQTDFSKNGYFAGMIRAILKDFGFALNPSKVKHGKNQISLSGYVVSDHIHLSRKKLHAMNRLLHFFGKTEEYTGKKYRVRKAVFHDPDWLKQVNALSLSGSRGAAKRFETPEELLDYLCGCRSFLISVLRIGREEDSSTRQLEKKVRKLEAVIDAILEHS